VIAGQLGLLEEEPTGAPLTQMLQRLNHFLCEAVVQNYRSIPPHSNQMEQVRYPSTGYDERMHV
jgi:hypothetical protein